MKFKLGLLLFIAGFAIISVSRQHPSKVVHADGVSSTQNFSSQPAQTELDSSLFPFAMDSESASSSSASGAKDISSAATTNSLSGARVDPLPEIANFLRQLDSVVIPTIYLPSPRRDYNFDYGKAKPSELKEKAVAGDPYAAYFYAEYIVKNNVRNVTDAGVYAYDANNKKRADAMDEAREFYIRGFRGGIASIADVLSRLYAGRGSNRIESLAWRKISFAVGESQRYDCLRNSTTCVVKDFNNINRLEFFYPCLSNSGDSCTQNDYDTAMVLALQYADSLEFAMNNKVRPAN